MEKNVLFIDYENIQNIDLPLLQDSNIEIKIFVGQSQAKIPFEFVEAAQTFGKSIEWVRIDGNGKNALDFHIAFYLGSLSKERKGASFIILSKDTGYDPLIRHVNKQNIACRRINSILELSKKNELLAMNNELMAKIMDNLTKINKNRRPRTRKTLYTHISALFQKKLGEAEISKVLGDAMSILALRIWLPSSNSPARMRSKRSRFSSTDRLR